MLQFFGSNQPRKRKGERSGSKTEQDRQYDSTKRIRTYQKSWEETYPWLSHDPENNIMMCKLCRKHNPTRGKGQNVFKSGTANFKKDSVRQHDESEAHQQAAEMEKAEVAEPGTMPAEKVQLKMKEAEHNRVSNIFRYSSSILFLSLENAIMFLTVFFNIPYRLSSVPHVTQLCFKTTHAISYYRCFRV